MISKIILVVKNNFVGAILVALIVSISVTLLVKGTEGEEEGTIPYDTVASDEESITELPGSDEISLPEKPDIPIVVQSYHSGFRNIKWGMSRAEVQESEGKPFDADSLWTATYRENQTVFGFDSSSVTFIFNPEDKLYKIQCTVNIQNDDKEGYDTDYNLLQKKISEIYGSQFDYRESAVWGDELRESEVDPNKWFEEMNLFKRKKPGDLSYYTSWWSDNTSVTLFMAGPPLADSDAPVHTYLVLSTMELDFFIFDNSIEKIDGLPELSDPEQFANIDYYLDKFQSKDEMILMYPEYESSISWHGLGLFFTGCFVGGAVTPKSESSVNVYKTPSTSAAIIDVLEPGFWNCYEFREIYLEGGQLFLGYYSVERKGRIWIPVCLYHNNDEISTGWVMQNEIE